MSSEKTQDIVVEVESLPDSLRNSAKLGAYLSAVCAELERRIREKENIRIARVRIYVNCPCTDSNFRHEGKVYYGAKEVPSELKGVTWPALRLGLVAYFRGAGSFKDFPKVKDVLVEIDFSASAKAAEKPFPREQEEDKASQLAEFSATEPCYSFDQIVLPEEKIEEIEKAIEGIRNRELIYREWGFSKIDPAAKTVLNFYGNPGTGKTMVAHAIAKRLGIKILVVSSAKIESSLWGEDSKNLVRAFEAAKRENALLFFDEADSFLGKRVEVSHAVDQALNSSRSNLLVLLENFEGVVVFCTNRLKNYDEAFMSRILLSLEFELPGRDARAAILKKTIPPEVPFVNGTRPTEAQFKEMASVCDGLSGRDLKNAVLKTLNAVAKRDGKGAKFSVSDFIKELERLKKEIEKTREELNEEQRKAYSEKVRDSIRKKTHEMKRERCGEDNVAEERPLPGNSLLTALLGRRLKRNRNLLADSIKRNLENGNYNVVHCLYDEETGELSDPEEDA